MKFPPSSGAAARKASSPLAKKMWRKFCAAASSNRNQFASIRDREAFRPHVVAALKGVGALDEQTRREAGGAEDRFLKSYPFHPDLTEVFYTKWTNLEAFQRTRGILRTFASALRDAEKWDTAPLIAANVFLNEPGKKELSEAAKQLTNVATTEEYEGKKQKWLSILEGELAKAREIEAETTGLKYREVEQSVVATFLHSQPIGARRAVVADCRTREPFRRRSARRGTARKRPTARAAGGTVGEKRLT